MTFISSIRLAVSLNDRAGARLRSTVQEWPGRKTRELLSGLLLNLVTFAIRLLPGMATFSPTMLSLIIGIVLHNIVRAAASAKQGVTLNLRWPVGNAIAMGDRERFSAVPARCIGFFHRRLEPHADRIDGVTLYDFGAASDFHRSRREAARHAGSTRTEFDAISHQRRYCGA
jgi:hypothetical protein